MCDRRSTTTAFDLAQRFVGMKEVPGSEHNSQIVAMLKLDVPWPEGDEVPWCAAFVNYVTWLLRLPRSKSLRARSWLLIGKAVPLTEARVGFDVVVLKRGRGSQPGPETIEAPGHVGFYAGTDFDNDMVYVLGGNQGNAVNVRSYPFKLILGIRRLV